MKTKLLFPALLITCALSAQEIHQVPTSFEEFQNVLETSGYRAYSFDYSAFETGAWDITLVCRAYEDHKLVHELTVTSFTPRVEDRTITISTLPSQKDSLGLLYISVPDAGRFTRSFKLHPLYVPGNPKPRYFYQARPFKPSALKNTEDDFLPLLLYGSGWVDDSVGAIRFCGEREIDPEMTAKVLEYLPHYYLFGLKYTKR